MKSFNQFKKEAFRDKKLKAAYDALEPEFEIAASLIKRRLEKKFTQQQLADRVGTKQSAIARLESGSYNPSLGFLKKVTHALDAKLKISVSAK